METIASKVVFNELAGLLERINLKKGTDEKKKMFTKFVDHWREFHKQIHGSNSTSVDSFYPAMRLLLPQLERERDAYGIKEHMLAKHYIEILGLGKDSPGAQKLLHYRAPKTAGQDAGDFAQVAYYILKPRLPEKGTLSIEQVNTDLDGIAQCNTLKDKAGVRRHLLNLLKNMSAQEQKWLIRIIMKELKTGLSQQSVFSVFHQDAEDLFNVKMSLEKVCTMLHDPAVRIHEVEVSIFSPFRPMLGDRGTPQKMEKLMEGKPFYIETKFDGERMQLHKQDTNYKYFSRNGNDFTDTYGSNSFDGNFSPYVHNCFKDNVTSCIIDGEMVGYNPVTKVIGSKGENFDIKSKNLQEYQPMLCVFDVLMLNGEVLSNKPLRQRKEILKTVFNEMEGRIVFSEFKIGKTNQDCIDALNEAIDDREEGIMIKDPETPYKPNTRKGGWYKLKPEYVSGLMDELDVLVVGGYFGVGKRNNLLSHFLCAVAVPGEEGEDPSIFHSFCKVGSGYTRKELYEFNAELAKDWRKFDKRNPPRQIVLASGLKQKPDMWIEPTKSKILQIKAAEIIESEQFKTQCTLRFPRVEKIRDDKPWNQCMTTAELKDLREKSEGKLAGQYNAELEDEDEPKKKRRKIVTKHVKPTVGSRFIGIDVSAVTKVSEMLSGKEICVLNGPTSHPKSELEKKVVECGGTIVQNPGDETYCVIASKVVIKVRNIISKGIHDVVKAEWLLNCIEWKKYIPWEPSDMLHTSAETAKKFALEFDRHGDSFIEDTDVEKLKQVFDKIEAEKSALPVTSNDIAEMEEKYFPQDSFYGLFRICRVYVDDNLVIGDKSTHLKASSLELTAMDLKFYGADIADKLDDQVTHVVTHPSDLSRVTTLRALQKKRNKKFHIVMHGWVDDCIKAEKLVQERLYGP